MEANRRTAATLLPMVAVMEDEIQQCSMPMMLFQFANDHAICLKDVRLQSSVSDADSEGNCVVSFSVPAKFRRGNDLFLPVSLASSSAPTTADFTEDATEIQIVEDCSGMSAGENMIRILPSNTGLPPLDMRAFGYMQPTVQASAVSVLTEPLSHAGGGGNADVSRGVDGIETAVLRCTTQPLFIPRSRQSSTNAWRSASTVVGSIDSSGCISVLSTPSLGSLMTPYQNPGSPGSAGSRPSPRPHICQHCNESHATANSLFAHLETVHGDTPKSLFTCETCGAAFFRRYRYHEHVHAYHTGDGDRQFTCTYPGCGKKYRYRRHLRRHSRCHGDVSEFRRFECEICGKRFPRVSQRDEHRNIHTGEKPFMCDICGAAYSHSSTLWLHRKRHESGKIDNTGHPIPGAGGKADDGVNVLNSSSDVSWQEGSVDGSLAEMSASDTVLETSAGILATAASADGGGGSGQSVIVHSESLDSSSAHVLVALSESDMPS